MSHVTTSNVRPYKVSYNQKHNGKSVWAVRDASGFLKDTFYSKVSAQQLADKLNEEQKQEYFECYNEDGSITHIPMEEPTQERDDKLDRLNDGIEGTTYFGDNEDNQ